jgi:CRP/FNR family transcriptional regulator
VLRELADPNGWLAAAKGGGSTMLLRRTARDRVEVEFHAVWGAGGPDRHRLFLRTREERHADAERAAVAGSSLASMPAATRPLVEAASRRWTRAAERLGASLRGGPWAVLVVAGAVRLYVAVDGAEPTLLYGRPGALLGTHWFSHEEATPVALQTITAGLLLEMDAVAIERLIDREPKYAQAVLGEGRRQVMGLVRSHAQRAAGSLPQRLARELLLLQRLVGDRFLAVTEQQVADSIGSIRESVARAIGDFRREGWIATTRFGIVILDADALARRAETDG